MKLPSLQQSSKLQAFIRHVGLTLKHDYLLLLIIIALWPASVFINSYIMLHKYGENVNLGILVSLGFILSVNFFVLFVCPKIAARKDEEQPNKIKPPMKRLNKALALTIGIGGTGFILGAAWGYLTGVPTEWGYLALFSFLVATFATIKSDIRQSPSIVTRDRSTTNENIVFSKWSNDKMTLTLPTLPRGYIWSISYCSGSDIYTSMNLIQRKNFSNVTIQEKMLHHPTIDSAQDAAEWMYNNNKEFIGQESSMRRTTPDGVDVPLDLFTGNYTRD